jgi:hypothetical protein
LRTKFAPSAVSAISARVRNEGESRKDWMISWAASLKVPVAVSVARLV